MRTIGNGLQFKVFNWPPVSVHWAVMVVPVALTCPLWRSMTNSGLLTALLVIPACVLSVLAHELGHAFAARRYGLDAEAIRLLPMGGEALIAGELPSRAADRVITLAGPLANLAIGLVCFGAYFVLLSHVSPNSDEIYYQLPPSSLPFYILTLLWMGWVNLALAGINLLPAYPLDGGKLAESFIEARWGSGVARFWIGTTGIVFATISTIALIATVLGGAPIWSPPSFKPNWKAIAASPWRPWRNIFPRTPQVAASTGSDAKDWLTMQKSRAKGDSPASNVSELKPRSNPRRPRRF